MKSALQNLADIAGYKLRAWASVNLPTGEASSPSASIVPASLKKLASLPEATESREQEKREDHQIASIGDSSSSSSVEEATSPQRGNGSSRVSQVERDVQSSLSTLLADSLGNQFRNGNVDSSSINNSTYTRYIEMAYAEVSSILSADKQMLIEVIRKLKTNEIKLKELEQLKVKVSASLKRLSEFASRLGDVFKHDSQIADAVRQMKAQIKVNQHAEASAKRQQQQLQSSDTTMAIS